MNPKFPPASNLQSRPIDIPEITINSRKKTIGLDLNELWHYRDLIYFLTWRDIKVRYKQTLLGAAWAILQPLLTMVLFSVIFGYLAKLPSDGIPYPVFTFTALLPWQLFAYALTQSSVSLVADQNLISKIYFPRLVIPVSSVLAGILDFIIAFAVLLGMFLIFRIQLTIKILALPFLIILAVFTALALGLWLSALNVKYRDVRYALPFITQLWFFATPIAYSSSLIPEQWQLLYSLNPMTGVVEGFRWALLDTPNSVGPMVFVSTCIVILLLVGGLIYFQRMEDEFADLI